MKKYYNIYLLSALTVVLAVSCQDDNFDWDKAHSTGKEIETAYAEHFKQIFGEVSPTQSWDFTQQESSETRAGLALPERFGGYSGNSRQSVDNWYSVPTALTTWLDTNLKEQVNNKSKGKPLAFSVPSNGEFDLIPVYQGMAYSYWHMNMGIQPMNGGDAKDPIKFWEKNQDIEINVNKVNWNRYGGVYHLKNKKNGKYVYWPRSRYIQISSSKKNINSNDYEDQLVFKLNQSVSWGTTLKISFDAKCSSANTSISLVAQKDNGSAGWWATNKAISLGTSWQNYSYEAFVTNSGIWGTIAANGANRIVLYFNKEKAERTYYIKNIRIEFGGSVQIVNGDLLGNDVSSFELYENNAQKTVSLKEESLSPYFETKPTSGNSQWTDPSYPNDQYGDVYTYSHDAGFRYAVVSVKTDNVEKKCLIAFRDKPEEAVYVGIDNSGKFYAIPLNNIASAPDIKTYTNDYYDHYLMLGDWLVYCDENGNLATQKVNKKDGSTSQQVYPWDMDLSGINNDASGYKWDFEIVRGFAYEQFMVTGESAPSDFNNGVWYYYDSSKNTKVWQSVRLDLGEMTMAGYNADNATATYKETRSKGYHFSGLTPGDVVYFYWDAKAPHGRGILNSLNDQMRIINYGSALEGIPSGKVVSIIGCEAGIIADMDANDPKEPDYNDMVFLLITDEEPKVVDVKDIEETIEKRYMVEDLGASDDIDFNDMVVDLKQVKKYEITTMSDGKSKKEYKSTTQTATLRAMGGTLDFDFKVGYYTVFTKSKLPGINYKNMYKTGLSGGKSSLLNDYTSSLYTCTIPNNAWDPSSNNVSFTVYKEGTSTASDGVYIDNNGAYTITFPNVGDEAPHIIAFPVTKLWRDERHECCSEWLYDREPALWEMPENDPDENKNTHTENFKDWIKSNRENYLQWIKTNFSDKVKEQIESWLNSKYPKSN